jgi:hypothetical protein
VRGARFVAWSPPDCAEQRAAVVDATVGRGADAGATLAVGAGVAGSIGRGDVCASMPVGLGEDVARFGVHAARIRANAIRALTVTSS